MTVTDLTTVTTIAPAAEPNRVLEAIVSLLVAGSVVIAGSAWIDTAGGSWFGSLDTPRWASGAPAVLGVGFTVVCALAALAVWLVVRQRDHRLGVVSALAAWMAQAALLLSWAWLMFNSHSPEKALGAALVLIVASTLTAVAFGRVSRLAGVAMLPTLAWSLAVTVLSGGLVVLN